MEKFLTHFFSTFPFIPHFTITLVLSIFKMYFLSCGI